MEVSLWKECALLVAILPSLCVKLSAPGEDRTHDLQMALVFVIMRLTRYLLRYRGTKNALPEA